MNTLNFNEVLKDFSYKPNFWIRAYEQDDQWYIRISMAVEDARKPLQPWVLKPIPQDEDYFFNDYGGRYRPPPSSSIGYSPSREMTEVMGNFPIPPYKEGQDQEFISWVVFQVRGVEEHEMDEWARYKGELIRDPHAEVKIDV